MKKEDNSKKIIKFEKSLAKKIKKMRKYPNVFFLIIFICIIFLLLLIYYFSFIQPENYTKSYLDRFFVTLRFLFVNEHNRLNWVGLSAIGVMISYVINSKFNRDKLRADLVSKSRMKWIQEMKQISTEIMSNADICISTFNTLISINMDTILLEYRKDEYRRVTDEEETLRSYRQVFFNTQQLANESFYEINKLKILFELQFGVDERNEELISKCDNLCGLIRCFKDQCMYMLSVVNFGDSEMKKVEQLNKDFQDLLNDFKISCRNYNYKEWKRATKGE